MSRLLSIANGKQKNAGKKKSKTIFSKGENMWIVILESREKTHNLQKILFILKLGRKDSNLRVSVPKTAALPLGDVPNFTQELTLKKEKVCCFHMVLT